jgi:hypothetical protein
MIDRPARRESGAQTTLFCPLKSRAHLPIGKPIAFVSNRKVLLALPAKRLSRWSNAVADDFVNRLAARAEIKKVGHCPKSAGHGSGHASRPLVLGERIGVMPKFPIHRSRGIVRPRPTDRQLGLVSKYRIDRERCLSVTRAASWVKS